jgi:hypothetical protein
VGRRQALGWLGAALLSVALIVAGGLILSNVAVDRYLQESKSMLDGTAAATGASPAPSELARVEDVVAAVTAMPGVATASSTMADPTALPTAEPQPSATPTAASMRRATDYDVSVIMTPDATAEQCANVVYAMTQEVKDARVNLQLSSPAGDGHGAAVVTYRHVFDTPVARSTVDSVSRSIAVVAAVPGVKSVRVLVPYTWNLASGDLQVEMATDDSHVKTALKNALARTDLAGVDWSLSR